MSVRYVSAAFWGALVGAVIVTGIVWIGAGIIVAYLTPSASVDAIPFYPPAVGVPAGAIVGAFATVHWAKRGSTH